MKLSDLSPTVIERIKSYRYDCIIEKHEGPERWASVLEYYEPEFMVINEYNVLLPIAQKRHSNIKILRCIVSDSGQTLTLFLKDTTNITDPRDELFFAGRVAICDKLEGEEFFLAILYHEWFIIENK
ncbi:MAG: hypothetical protein HY731_03090 [Candidatus Tectomicrobia bacterium]|nr:hypothetical protein [Candidatus Tectomicrobia bacterium]